MIKINKKFIYLKDFPEDARIKIDDILFKIIINKIYNINICPQKFFVKIYTKHNKVKIKTIKSFYYNFLKEKIIPLWMLNLILNQLKIKVSLEKHVCAYKFINGQYLINKPKLPIEVSPVFDSIVAHLYFDGGQNHDYKNSGGGRYTQINQIAKNRFKEKIEFVFGKINSKAKTDYKFNIPVTIIEIIKRYYKIYEFSSDNGRLPKSMLNKSKLSKVAILTACLIDEGYISDQVDIVLGNAKLLNDIRKICLDLNYSVSKIKRKGRGYRIIINSRNKLFNDITKLIKKYPICDLAHKMGDLEFRVKLSKNRSRKWNLTKLQILNLLDYGKITAKDLSKNLFITKGNILKALRYLENKDLIKREFISNNQKGGRIFWSKKENDPLLRLC